MMERMPIVTLMAKLATPEAPQMIGLDWGTSSLRAFLVGSDGSTLAERNGSDGIMAVGPDTDDLQGDFSRLAHAAIGDWLNDHGPLPILACGMIGSTQGVAEAGYLDLPTDLYALGRTLTSVELTIGELHIVPGLQKTSTEATAPDVIRGEETQLLGLLDAEQPDATTVILPGTHTKWVSCQGQRVTDFSTSMSGEMFGLLSTSSILSRLAEPTDDFHPDAFDWGLSVGAAYPGGLTSSIFSARTWALDGRLRAEEVNDYLSWNAHRRRGGRPAHDNSRPCRPRHRLWKRGPDDAILTCPPPTGEANGKRGPTRRCHRTLPHRRTIRPRADQGEHQ